MTMPRRPTCVYTGWAASRVQNVPREGRPYTPSARARMWQYPHSLGSPWLHAPLYLDVFLQTIRQSTKTYIVRVGFGFPRAQACLESGCGVYLLPPLPLLSLRIWSWSIASPALLRVRHFQRPGGYLHIAPLSKGT
jgi:hypothetical protein